MMSTFHQLNGGGVAMGTAGVHAGVTWDSMRPACVIRKRALPAIIYLLRRRRGRPRSHGNATEFSAFTFLHISFL